MQKRRRSDRAVPVIKTDAVRLLQLRSNAVQTGYFAE